MSAAASDPRAAAPCNVCGLVVHVRPDRVESVEAEISALPGVEIHQAADQGRLVVTAIDEDGVTALDQIAAINRIPGVVSTSLVYHALDAAD
jgi:nitrate reductase NapD